MKIKREIAKEFQPINLWKAIITQVAPDKMKIFDQPKVYLVHNLLTAIEWRDVHNRSLKAGVPVKTLSRYLSSRTKATLGNLHRLAGEFKADYYWLSGEQNPAVKNLDLPVLDPIYLRIAMDCRKQDLRISLLSDWLGIPKQKLSRFLQGLEQPSPKELKMLAHVLQVSEDFLLVKRFSPVIPHDTVQGEEINHKYD